MRYYHYLGISILLLVSLILFLPNGTLSDQASDFAYNEQGIVILDATTFPSGDIQEIQYANLEKECVTTLKEITPLFPSITSVTKKAELFTQDAIPILLIKTQQEELFISQQAACSPQVITNAFCEISLTKPSVCNFQKKPEPSTTPYNQIDSPCVKCCNFLFTTQAGPVLTFGCGTHCGYIEGYSPRMEPHFRNCESSCESDEQDIACCPKENCVANEQCFSPGLYADIEGDGSKEVCVSQTWLDPDTSSDLCTSPMQWVSQKSAFRTKEMCCGDDPNEVPTACTSSFCKDQQPICCKKDQCAYDGKCYKQGCQSIEDTQVFCKQGQWVDLDALGCEECVGKDAWNGQVCCGDDPNEGPNPIAFSIVPKTISYQLSQCSHNEKDCAVPFSKETLNPGCYEFSNHSALDGTFLCKNTTWYDPDEDQSICQGCNLEWKDNTCCGDDTAEKLITGDDGTSACCPTETYCVEDGKCVVCDSCGNNNVEQNEHCEFPDSNNNPYCEQQPTRCRENKLGTRDSFGYCGEACDCSEDAYTFTCVKDKCGAECNSDGSGCGNGFACNTNDCTCYKEEILKQIYEEQQCPHRIFLSTSKEEYDARQTIALKAQVQDEKKVRIPQALVVIETFVNEKFQSQDHDVTDALGEFTHETRTFLTSEEGVYNFIARVYFKECPVIADQHEVEVKITPPESGYTPPKPGDRSTINRSKKVQAISLDRGVCGDGIINRGELCEGNAVCRNSLGCDYNQQTFDPAETCVNCNCPKDFWSVANAPTYCDNCRHCGDGTLNCGEECDQGVRELGTYCEQGNIFKEIERCVDCAWTREKTEDIWIEECRCDCPAKPETNCIEGNFILYPEDYNPGCNGNQCAPCSCEDKYAKDSDNDGIEDRCGPELCNNGRDDNDNGRVDEENCLWYYCNDCGHGLWNLCDQQECLGYDEECLSIPLFSNTVSCLPCSRVSSCNDYTSLENCNANPCQKENCLWKNENCCSDNDNDGLCNSEDNCVNTINHNQSNTDADEFGDACDLCPKEPNLSQPSQQNETSCFNNIDDDCDGMLDCQDPTCLPICNATLSLDSDHERVNLSSQSLKP